MVQEGSAPRTRLRLEIAQHSDPGKDPNKQINEDSCGYVESQHGHLAVLCDGMGGHYGGQEASRLAIKTIFEEMTKASAQLKPAQALKKAVETAALRVYELGGPADNKTRPGSTVVAMILHDGGVDVAHVGDSRAYVIRSSQIYPLTRDHSMVQGLIDAGQLTEEQAIGHPDANKITRALGMKPEVDVELRPEPMELFAGDLLLQTSDGLTDLALARDILGATMQALASGGLDHACKQLVQLANDRGGHDNITVQLARIVETGPSRTAIPGATAPPSPTHAPTQALALTPTPLAATPLVSPVGPAPSAGGVGVAPTVMEMPAGPGPTAPGSSPTPHQPAAALARPPVTGADAEANGPPSQPIWASGMYARPGDGRLAAFNLDGAQALAPPPASPSASPGAVPKTLVHGATPASPTVNESYDVPPYGSPYAGAPATPTPFSYSPQVYARAAPPPSRGGIVFLITGVSILLAVLILVALWAAGLLD